MNRIWQWLSLVSIVLSIGCVAYVALNKNEREAYIDTYKVYSGFIMTKRLQKQVDEMGRVQAQKLDSLKLEIDMAMSKASQQKNIPLEFKKAIEYKRQEYIMRQQQAENERQTLADKYDAQIWAQLNQYMSDYGKANKLKFIFGANGSGSLMYGSSEQDVTEEMIKYVNDRHQDL